MADENSVICPCICWATGKKAQYIHGKQPVRSARARGWVVAASSRDGSPMAAGQADRDSGASLGEGESKEEGEAWRRLRRCYAPQPPPRRAARSPPQRAAGPLHPPPQTSVFVVWIPSPLHQILLCALPAASQATRTIVLLDVLCSHAPLSHGAVPVASPAQSQLQVFSLQFVMNHQRTHGSSIWHSEPHRFDACTQAMDQRSLQTM